MTAAGTTDPLLTITDIARELGLGTSAVSNWRKRHADFPAPAETSESGKEMFRLSEVNRWLRSTRRDEIRLDLSNSLWHSLWQSLDRRRGGHVSDDMPLQAMLAALVLRQRLHAAGKPSSLAAALAHTGHTREAVLQLLVRAGLAEHEYAFNALSSVMTEMPEILSAVDVIDPEEIVVVFEALLTRWVDAAGMRGSGTTTNESVAQLISRIAPDGDTLLDPAIGFGNTVVAVLDHFAANGVQPPHVVGQEINEAAWTVVVLRLLVHGVDAFAIQHGNSLLEDGDPNRRVDLVVADPPYNQRDWGAEHLLGDPRWRFGVPTDRDANAAWIQHVIHHLSRDGQAMVVVPPGVLFGSGRGADFRRSLLAAGVVEGAVALPAGLAPTPAIPLALLLLRSPDAGAKPPGALLINANSDEHLAPRTVHARMLSSAVIDQIAAAVTAFRRRPEDFETRPGFATTVPTHTLLADSNATLNPQQWVEAPTGEAKDFANDLTDAFDRITRSLAEIRQAPDLPKLSIHEPEQRSRGIQLRDIALTDAVEVLRPGRLDKGDYTTSGTPVLTQTALSRDGSPPKFDRYVDLESVPGRQVITRPGDVILATVGQRPYAVVDHKGGAVLGINLELLRIHADWLDPEVVAACLSSSQTARAVTGTTIPRVRLRDLTLPAITAETTAAVRDSLERLREVELAARQLASTAAEAQQHLIEAVVAGNSVLKEA